MVSGTSEALRFCVVTPSLNMAPYLQETIESVLANLNGADEYYVIDGGSTDNTRQIIENYADKLAGWVSEPDSGYADAVSKGFSRSAAPLMCWINTGDIILPGTLDMVRERFARDDTDLLFGDDYYIDEAGRVLQQSKGYVRSLSNMMLYGGWTPLQDSCFWRRSLYERCGGIDPGRRFAADFDLFLRMSLYGRCRYFPAVLSAFRRHAAQKSIMGSAQYDKERKAVQRQMINQYNEPASLRVSKRIVFPLAVRFRAHVAFMNRRKSRSIGRNVGDLSAELLG